jgi:hypothetical protein
LNEVKGNIEESYTKWALITQDHKVARECLFGKTASDVRPFSEDEMQLKRIALERRLIIARISELREMQREMTEDDTGKNELVWKRLCSNHVEDARSLVATLKYYKGTCSP